MGLKIPKVMIAAVKSGSGKTTITCAFLKQLLCRKKHPVSFKCGPDYIDPMFHEQVLKIPSKNLDTFFSDASQIQALYEMELPGHDIAVLEGVMGLYDGLGGIREEGSSYHLAKTLDVPVILVVDAHGMGKSVIPLIAGFLQYDEKKLIKGVILNRTSKMFFDTIAPLIELGAGFDMDLTARENIYLNGTVLGYTPKYIDSKFDDIVEFSELQEFLDVPLKNYSSGMVARLAFAVATMTKPDILIADEILSVGDFLFQEKCEKRMAELLSGGTTVILVSHSIEQIERMCNKVAWLDHGHLRRLGPTKEVTAEYRKFEKKDAMKADKVEG